MTHIYIHDDDNNNNIWAKRAGGWCMYVNIKRQKKEDWGFVSK